MSNFAVLLVFAWVHAWLSALGNAQSPPSEHQCLALIADLALPNTIVNVAQFVYSGTIITFPDNHPTCDRPSQVVSTDLCRLALNVTTSPFSSIILEVWLPTSWSGRFLGTGTQGFSGCEIFRCD
jgi:feruloyl esterase